MKPRNYFLLSLLAIIAGVVFILSYTTISSVGLVVFGGVLFIVTGLLNLALNAASRRRAEQKALSRILGYLTSFSAVLLGLSMLVFQSVFTTVIPYLFCFVIALLSLLQFGVLLSRRGRTLFSSWFLLVPLALAGVSVYVAIQPVGDSDSTIMLASGIGLVFAGLFLLVEGIVVKRSTAAFDTCADEADIEVADAEKLDGSAPIALDDAEK